MCLFYYVLFIALSRLKNIITRIIIISPFGECTQTWVDEEGGRLGSGWGWGVWGGKGGGRRDRRQKMINNRTKEKEENVLYGHFSPFTQQHTRELIGVRNT